MEKNAKLNFQVNPNSGVPIYRQIIDQVRIGIAIGRFSPGNFLPSVREISVAFDINPMTVSKAYSLLEKDGVIEFVRGQGMRVPQQARTAGKLEAQEEIAPLLQEVVNRAQQLSLDQERVVEKLQKIWEGYSHE